MNCEGCLNKDDCANNCKDQVCMDCVIAEKAVEDKYFHELKKQIIRVGDVVALKGRIFKVKNVKPSELRLKPVKMKGVK